MNLKFWEWFKKKQETDPTLFDPTDAALLREYQDAIGIQRIPMSSIDRHDLTSNEVSNPDLGTDDAETLKKKLKYGIHQSTMRGVDTHNVSGVRAIAEDGGKAEVIMKIDKSKLYELGYDIEQENDTFVKDLGLVPEKTTTVGNEVITESEIPLPVGATAATPELERLRLEGVDFHRYSGKPQDRPWEMKPNPALTEEQDEWSKATGVMDIPASTVEVTLHTPEMEESVAARIEAFHAKAKDHDTYCDLHGHYLEHIDKLGNEYDCHHYCGCKKEDHGDDQGNAVPV
jgi:hypothetical protein